MLYVFHFASLTTFPPDHLKGCGSGNPPAGEKSTNCVLACEGDSTQICGGVNALGLYFRQP